DAPQTVAALGELLRGRNLHGLVVKMAAELAERVGAKGLAVELGEGVTGLIAEGAAKRDAGGEGKTGAGRAVGGGEADLAELYVAAARYRQMEPVMNGAVDTAAEFRGMAALGLAFSRPANAIVMLVDLLADSERKTRMYAAIALGTWRGPEALPALR